MLYSILHTVRLSTLLLAALSAQASASTKETVAVPAVSAGLAGHRLQQVALTTTNLPRAIVFYRDVLGLPLLFESNGMAFFDVAGTRLMIALDPKRVRAPPSSILYFDAPNFDTMLARFEALRIHFVGPVETVQRSAKGDLKLRQFEDPDGNMLAIMGLIPKS